MSSTAPRAALVVPQQGNPKSDLWEEALNALSAEDRKQFVDSSTSSHEVLQKVQEATENAKEACVAKGWRVYKKKNGEYVTFRRVLEKLSVWVESAIKIVDLGVSFDQSGHAALPWGVVKSIVTVIDHEILMGKSNVELFSNIVEQIESISSLIARYAVIEKLYLDGASEATIGLRGSITNLYAAILTYLARAKLYFSENDLRQIGRGLLEAARKHYDAARLSEKEIHNWMTIVDRELDRETAKLMIKNYEDLERILHDFNKPITRMAIQMNDLHDDLNREERTKIFHWLSKIDYGRHHEDLSKHLLPDTGQWLFKSQQFIEWRQPNVSSILWIHGIPGSGKTRLVSRIIDVMSDESTSRRPPIAFFYCARSTAEPERGKPVEVLGAILKQLCSSEPDEPIRNPLATEYAARIRKADYDYSRIRRLSVEDCTGLILELTNDNPATIIVDALDECDEETRYELLDSLDNIIANSVEVVKVLASSRDDVDIKLHLKQCNNISISADRNESDIARFVLSEVDRLVSKERLLDGWVPKKLKKRIIKTLTNGAQGMFRWVVMSLETLQQIKFRPDFEKALGRLPSKLSELYDIVHSDIDKTEAYGRDVATKTLKWLLCAQRLLTIEELAAAVQLPYNEIIDSSSGSDDSEETDDETKDRAIGSSSSSDDRNQKDIETETWIEDNIIRLCRNLVVVDSERTGSEQTDSGQQDSKRKIFRFAHQSVREYLLARKEYTDIEQHALVVERCLEIYEVETSPDPAEPNLTRQNETLKLYARGYWPVHYKYLDDSGSLEPRRKLRSFVIQDSKKSSPYMQWIDDMMNAFALENEYNVPGAIKRSLGLEWGDPLTYRLAYALAEPYTYLSMICAFGLSSLLNELEIPSVELNHLLKLKPEWREEYETDCTTLLKIASEQGHAQTVQTLLDKGATIDISDQSCRSPLFTAIKRGHEAIAQILLRNGPDLNAKGNTGALQIACRDGSEHLVRTLLDGGASVNAKSDEYMTALMNASSRGVETTVQMLLAHGADVKARGSLGESALICASQAGHESIVRMLLKHGADVNALNYDHEGALHPVSVKGQESIVRLLLEHGADVNVLDFRGKSALHGAAVEGHLSIVQMLLENGAEINARNEQSETSLFNASSEGHESVVQTLLEHGADVNSRDEKIKTPLHNATEKGYNSVVQILLAHGAEINARDNNNWTPLQIATKKGYNSVVQLLLEHGADVNAGGNWGYTSLHEASCKGYESVVQMLLDHGADVNARDEDYRTPLHFVSDSSWGIKSVVQLLLEHGAKIDARDSSGCSPLHFAAKTGCQSLVQILLDRGADINAQDRNGRTPLREARNLGKDGIVQLLLRNGAAADEDEEIEWRNLSAEEEEDQSGESEDDGKDNSEDDSDDTSKDKKRSASEAGIDEASVRDDTFEV